MADIDVLMRCSCSDGGANLLLLLAVFAGWWLLFSWIKTLIKSKGVSGMNKAIKIVIVLVLAAVVVAVIAVKQQGKSIASESTVAASSNTVTENPLKNSENTSNTETLANLPRLVDLGAGKCIPCKMMAPILEELKTEYQGKLQVVFVDVWEKPNEAKKYKINIIPTQIFYDAGGKELFRHEGFFSKEDILGKWKEFGINFEKGTNNETN